MTRIGAVERVFPFHEDSIITLRVESDTELRIKNGDAIRFGGGGEVIVSGLKFWPERGAIDVLIKKGDRIPKPRESVYISSE